MILNKSITRAKHSCSGKKLDCWSL